MRETFIRSFTEMAEADDSLVLMTGDLGFKVLDEFRERCPGQFYNVGVAEQNLAGVAAGMALAGHTVVTYSIGNFPTLRALEHIRNDICYHDARVKIVTVGGGMAYGALGPSHFATEDLAVMRSLPGLTVVAPGDPWEVRELTPQLLRHPGPVYLRLGRSGEIRQHQPGAEVVMGKPSVVRPGRDLLLLSTGGILDVVMEAAEALLDEGISAEVVSVHTLSPLDGDGLVDLARRYDAVITCEEHITTGGLGGAVAEVLMEGGVRAAFRRFGLAPGFPEGVGSQDYLRTRNGIHAPALRGLALEALESAGHRYVPPLEGGARAAGGQGRP